MPIWANQVSPLQNWYPIIYIHNDMINSVRYAELGDACLARKKHIITCSGAPWHAVIKPRQRRWWVLLAQCETLGEYMSAWRIEIRTGFYHRAEKTRPIKGLK